MKFKHLYLALMLALGMVCTFSGLQAQENKPAPAGEAAATVHTKTLWERIKHGGWVMFPIGACSIITLYLMGDGVMRTRATTANPPSHVEAVKDAFRSGDYVGAYNFCKENPSPFSNVCRVAVSSLGDGKAVVEDSIMGELAKENSHMQTYISYLSVIGVCTPMIGLLGTVTGMMTAFDVLGSSGIGDPSQLSAAIGEVLVATAAGLFIAIPAFSAFYFLRNRAAKALHNIQDTLNSLFRKMPYAQLEGVHIGDEEIYAAPPNWVAPEDHSK